MRYQKLITFIFFFIGALWWPQLTQATEATITNPKLANVFLKLSLTDAEAEALAKWDVLILDMENQVNNPQALKKIKQLNPNIKILVYITAQEIRSDVDIHKNMTLRQKLFSQIASDWYLYKPDKRHASFWPETWTLNFAAPVDNNREQWADYLPKWLQTEILSSGLWDGIFYDNLFDSVSWLHNGDLDIDNNGVKDEAAVIDQQWSAGIVHLLQTTRRLIGYDYLVLANSASHLDYQPYLNGRLFENFPLFWHGDGSWQNTINIYEQIRKINVQPQIYIINSANGSFSDYFKMRYGLITTLLFDNLYFSADKVTNEHIEDHGQTWWYDEFNFNLGRPLSAAQKIISLDNSRQEGVWQRDFVNGVVFLNNSSVTQEINLPAGLKRLVGSQDKQTNNGQSGTILKLAARDGIVLEREVNLVGLPLKNKLSYQVINQQNKVVHSPVSISSSKFKPGELVTLSTSTNIIKTQRKSDPLAKLSITGVSSKNKSLVRIYNKERKLVGIFKAYPDNLKAGVQTVLGDVDGDSQLEIITLPFWGEPNLKIFSLGGRLKSEFNVFSNKNKAFYDLVLKDVNGDGTTEILVASY